MIDLFDRFDQSGNYIDKENSIFLTVQQHKFKVLSFDPLFKSCCIIYKGRHVRLLNKANMII